MDYMLPLAVIRASWGKQVDTLVQVYKNDTGLSWEGMSNDCREMEGAMNEPPLLSQGPSQDYGRSHIWMRPR
jgi:hypothetical protein